MDDYRTVSISELKPGDVLATPVFDERLVKLLDAGITIDQRFIERLQSLGITDVLVQSSAETVVSRPRKSLRTGLHTRPTERVGSTAIVGRCSACGSTITLQPPVPNSTASPWVCENCGALYFGSDEGSTERRGVLRVDPAVHNPLVAGGPPPIPPENVQRLVKSLAPEEYNGPDRRGYERYPVIVPVIAMPLALDFRVIGEPVQMTTANVSLGGAALVHTRYVNAPYLALDFTVAGVDLLQVVFKVLRVRSLGPVYEVAGEFISRLSEMPVQLLQQ